MSDFDEGFGEPAPAETSEENPMAEAVQGLEDFSDVHTHEHLGFFAMLFPAAPALISIIWTSLIAGGVPFMIWWFAKWPRFNSEYFNNIYGKNNAWLYTYNWWILMAGNGAIYGLSFFVFLLHAFGLFPDFAQIWMFWVVQFGGGLVFSTVIGFYAALMFQYHKDYKSQLAGTFTKAQASDLTPNIGIMTQLSTEIALYVAGQALTQHYINSQFNAFMVNIETMRVGDFNPEDSPMFAEDKDAAEDEAVEEDIDF